MCISLPPQKSASEQSAILLNKDVYSNTQDILTKANMFKYSNSQYVG